MKKYIPYDYRFVFAALQYAGYNSPRESHSEAPLPSARKISEKLYQLEAKKKDPIYTLMHMTFGQFLDHDLDRTAISKLSLEGVCLYHTRRLLMHNEIQSSKYSLNWHIETII